MMALGLPPPPVVGSLNEVSKAGIAPLAGAIPPEAAIQ
jgi:hypothetical protein